MVTQLLHLGPKGLKLRLQLGKLRFAFGHGFVAGRNLFRCSNDSRLRIGLLLLHRINIPGGLRYLGTLDFHTLDSGVYFGLRIGQ